MNVEKSKEILEALVGFDTVSRNSNLGLIAWVEQYLDKLGVKHERVYDDTGKKSNLWATVGPAEQRGYILSGHTDVVPVDDQNWTDSPFRLTERGYSRAARPARPSPTGSISSPCRRRRARASRPACRDIARPTQSIRDWSCGSRCRSQPGLREFPWISRRS